MNPVNYHSWQRAGPATDFWVVTIVQLILYCICSRGPISVGFKWLLECHYSYTSSASPIKINPYKQYRSWRSKAAEVLCFTTGFEEASRTPSVARKWILMTTLESLKETLSQSKLQTGTQADCMWPGMPPPEDSAALCPDFCWLTLWVISTISL